MPLFESYERRIGQITPVLEKYGMKTLEDAKAVCESIGVDPYAIVKETQPIAFENAGWAYVLGAAIAIKKGCKKAADAAEAIGEGLYSWSDSISITWEPARHANSPAFLLLTNQKLWKASNLGFSEACRQVCCALTLENHCLGGSYCSLSCCWFPEHGTQLFSIWKRKSGTEEMTI